MSSGRLPDPIAIDGPAASGKSTLGRAIAERLGYHFLDTGLMYRAFTLAALEGGVEPTPEATASLVTSLNLEAKADGETRVLVDGVDVTDRLREPAVEENVSRYSALLPVREAMVALQREVAARGMAVLAGRDIGTVVLPGAPLKIYLDASERARSIRRDAQAGRPRSAATRAAIARRDNMDSTRAAAPLAAAPDAVVVDTTAMTIEEVIDFVMRRIQCAPA